MTMIKLLCTKDKEPTGFLIQDVTDWEAMYNVNIILKQIEETASFYLFKHNEHSSDEEQDLEDVADWYLMHEDHLPGVLWNEAQLNGIFDFVAKPTESVNDGGGTYEITSLQDHCYGKFSDKAYYINPNSNYIH